MTNETADTSQGRGATSSQSQTVGGSVPICRMKTGHTRGGRVFGLTRLRDRSLLRAVVQNENVKGRAETGYQAVMGPSSFPIKLEENPTTGKNGISLGAKRGQTESQSRFFNNEDWAAKEGKARGKIERGS